MLLADVFAAIEVLATRQRQFDNARLLVVESWEKGKGDMDLVSARYLAMDARDGAIKALLETYGTFSQERARREESRGSLEG